MPDEQAAAQHALETASLGDLVLILGDNVKRTWKQIIYFDSGSESQAGTSTPTTISLPDTAGFEIDESLEIISDERGVRIAREEGD